MAARVKYQAYLPAIYQIGRYPIGYTDLGDAPRIGLPPVWAFISGGGIQFDPILILPVLSILPYRRP